MPLPTPKGIKKPRAPLPVAVSNDPALDGAANVTKAFFGAFLLALPGGIIWHIIEKLIR